MKHYINHFIKRSAFLGSLVLFFLVVSCEKEQINQQTEDSAVKPPVSKNRFNRVDVKDIPVLQDFMATKMQGFSQKSLTSGTVVETPYGDIPLEDVLQVVDTEGNTNYTFKIIPANLFATDKVYNLVISKPVDEEETSAYVLEINRTINRANQTQTIGAVNKYRLEDFLQPLAKANTRCPELEDQGATPICQVFDPIENGDGSGDDGDADSGGGGDDGNSPSDVTSPPIGPISVNTNVVIVISGDASQNGDEEQISQGSGGCWILTEAYMDNNGSDHIYYEYFDPCPHSNSNKSSGISTKSRGGDCPDATNTGIEIYGMNFSSISIARSDFLQQNCLEAGLLSNYYRTSDRSSTVERIIEEMTDVFIKHQDTQRDLQVISNMITALQQKILKPSEVIQMLQLMDQENNSIASVNASGVTIHSLLFNTLSGPYDQAYYDAIDQYFPADTTDPFFGMRFAASCAAYKMKHPDWSDWRIYWEVSKEMIHLGLDIVGLIPVVGEAADFTNAAIYLLEGDGVNATLSLASTIPFAGWAAAGTKFAAKVVVTAGGERALKVIAQGTEAIGEVAIKASERVAQSTINAISTVTNTGVTSKITSEIAETKLFAETVEEAAQEIVDTANKQNRKFSWEEVKAFFKRGNDFNAKAKEFRWYKYDEIHLANGKRLDSYTLNNGGEIVSRKATDLGNIKFSTFDNYLKEMGQKYSPGTTIRSNKYPDIDGQTLTGQQILEIPASNQSLSNIQDYIDHAWNNYGIRIRFRPE